MDVSYHSQSHGGIRRLKFDTLTQNLIRTALWDLFTQFPLGNIPFFVRKLNELDFSVNYDDVQKVFKSWKWSWKSK